MPELLYEDTDKKIYLDDPGEYDEDGNEISPRVERRVYSDPQVDNLHKAAKVLKQWARDADKVNVTSQNAVQTLQVVVDRLGIFFDNFADLLETQYGRE